jgi:signal peptidase I
MAANRISVIVSSFLLIASIVIHPSVSRAELKEYTVAGESMSPALLTGDKVLVDTDVRGPYRRGDLVSVAFRTSKVPMVKRIAAVPGDRVQFLENAVWVNEKRVREIYMRRWKSTIKQVERFGHIVPVGYYLILGDNPINSRDSGRLGLISRDHLKGKVIRVIKTTTY